MLQLVNLQLRLLLSELQERLQSKPLGSGIGNNSGETKRVAARKATILVVVQSPSRSVGLISQSSDTATYSRGQVDSLQGAVLIIQLR